MIRRPLMLTGLLGAAAGGPYLASQAPDEWPPLWPEANTQAAQEAEGAPSFNFQPPDASSPRGPGSPAYQSLSALEGPQGLSLEQVFDWNITRNWVYERWARKSTGLADPSLYGVRVPLVTGSAMTDVAGSLSYYFDSSGVLQRIRLNGQTADTTRLAQVAIARFGMQQRLARSPGDQLFQAVEGGRVRGELRTRPDGVLWATSPHESFAVELEMNRPGGTRWVEPPKLQLDVPTAPPASPQTAEAAAANAREAGSPILPPRSVVPDRPPVSTASNPAGAQSVGATTQSTPAPPPVGAPTTAPPSQMKPLDGYRDRFRWPG